MRNLIAALLFTIASASPCCGKVVVYWQDGFPTVASQPVTREALTKALGGADTVFIGTEGLHDPAAFTGVDLFVLPYGSAFPADAWADILAYLRSGGNLLVLGGQPFHVPVKVVNGKFIEGPEQDAYARELGFRHSYTLAPQDNIKFAWREGYSFLGTHEIHARRFFVVEGHLNGLGYMVNSESDAVAAPVIVADYTNIAAAPGASMQGSRMVMLDFEPEPGYWESPDGTELIRQTANYALQGATSFWLEMLFSTVKPGEPAQIVVHLRNARRERQSLPLTGSVKVELLSGDNVLDSAVTPCSGNKVSADLFFRKALAPGFYTVRGVYEESGQTREFHQSGFWVEDEKLLNSGPVLGTNGDFLTKGDKPFFPVGTNYFTTEENGWDFSSPRNAWTWDHDFAEMARHGVTFVRTGVWMPNLRFVEPLTDEVNERFLRNLEAYLLCARRHDIIINFTFFAFVPRTNRGGMQPAATVAGSPVANPYTDPASLRVEQDYVLSVLNRFKDIPWLCWDLINEPSFSNPLHIFRGNIPNGDPTEISAWHKWLQEKYPTVAGLAVAWRVTPEQLGSFDAVPLPSDVDLTFGRYGNSNHVRAVDYNLFAQDMFTRWVRTMVITIRSTGSKQLIDVGQDEGGVTDRVLNQFYAAGGVSFTTNHTYWRDDSLLWDSVVAKRPGIPNIVGETGYQPVWEPDGTWRYDEITGYALLERKWALGFAAGNSGILQWDWAREVDFGMQRSDGSAKSWENMMSAIGRFAATAAPFATGIIPPQVAVVLPQTFQLSTFNALALEAQQNSVRALYQYAHGEAYAVGEYQIDLLGDPKLIILPSSFVLTPVAWDGILAKVRAGATLLVTGPFDDDAHFHTTGRQNDLGLDYAQGLLALRENLLKWPGGEARLTYSGDKTTYLNRAVFADGSNWAEKTIGKGKILFVALPLELNDNLQAVGDVYRYALKVAGVTPIYTSTLQDPGILICPTRFPHATLYVLTSESNQRADISFRDQATGKQFSGKLDSGRAALLLVSDDGSLLASYNWTSH
jgi:glycosyl hydrolase family 42 (putative beta-galactosidase)